MNKLKELQKEGQRDSPGPRVSFNKLNPLALNINGDEDDDPIDEEDQMLQQDIEVRRGPRTVKLDFNSDSSDNEVINHTGGKNKGDNQDSDNDDEDDDMFGGDSDDETSKAANAVNEDLEYRKKKKSVQLMDMNAFEKQEGLQGDGGDIYDVSGEDYDDEDDYSDEITESNADINYFVNPDVDPTDSDGHSEVQQTGSGSVSAKKHEPKMEGFNLRADLEEGQFDVDGNFIRNAADEGAHHDLWLNGVSKKDIAKAREAQQLREQREKEQSNSKEFVAKADILSELISYLDIGESPIEALQRLGKKKQAVAAKSKRKNAKSTTLISAEDKLKESDRMKKVEAITDLTDKLAKFGSIEVYNKTREELSREYQRETGQSYMDLKRKRSRSPQPEKLKDEAQEETENEDKDEPKDKTTASKDETALLVKDPEAKWEYTWEGSDEIHGPYTTSEMASWAYYNYFDERVSIRQAGVGENEFVNYLNVKFE